MKLLVLYGPPAAGKLTIGKEIAKRTSFRLFHNHLAIDLVEVVFPDRDETRMALVSKIWLDIIEAATKANKDLIFTFVYAPGYDDKFIVTLINTVEDNGGEICFAQIVPTVEVLHERLGDEARQNHSKITDPALLDTVLKKWDLYSPIHHPTHFILDNSALSLEEAAEKIIQHFHLLT